MPLAISPLTYAKRVPCTSVKLRSPSHSGYMGASTVVTGRPPAARASVSDRPVASPRRPLAGSATTNTVSRTRSAMPAIESAANAGAVTPVQPATGDVGIAVLTSAAAGRMHASTVPTFTRRGPIHVGFVSFDLFDLAAHTSL